MPGCRNTIATKVADGSVDGIVKYMTSLKTVIVTVLSQRDKSEW